MERPQQLHSPAAGREPVLSSQGMTETPGSAVSLERRLRLMERALGGGEEPSRKLDFDTSLPEGESAEAGLQEKAERLARLERQYADQESDRLLRQKGNARQAQHSALLDSYLKQRGAMCRQQSRVAPVRTRWAVEVVDSVYNEAKKKAAEAAKAAAPQPVPDVKFFSIPVRSRTPSPRPRTPRSGQLGRREEIELHRRSYQLCRPASTPPPSRKLTGHDCRARGTVVATTQGWDSPQPPDAQAALSAEALRTLKRRHLHVSPRREPVQGAAPTPRKTQRDTPDKLHDLPEQPVRRSPTPCHAAWSSEHTSHTKIVPSAHSEECGWPSQAQFESRKRLHAVTRAAPP